MQVKGDKLVYTRPSQRGSDTAMSNLVKSKSKNEPMSTPRNKVSIPKTPSVTPKLASRMTAKTPPKTPAKALAKPKLTKQPVKAVARPAAKATPTTPAKALAKPKLTKQPVKAVEKPAAGQNKQQNRGKVGEKRLQFLKNYEEDDVFDFLDTSRSSPEPDEVRGRKSRSKNCSATKRLVSCSVFKCCECDIMKDAFTYQIQINVGCKILLYIEFLIAEML